MTVLASPKQEIKFLTIGVLSLAHMFNDLYANFWPAFLLVVTGLSATRAAILVSVFSISSSFVQPIFGYYLDRRGKRWLVHVGTLWMAVLLSLTGFVHSFGLLVILAALSGLGTAAFHPQASTMVNVSSGNYKAVIMSVFVTCGNIGFALSPLLLVPLFENYGLPATGFTVIPGILVALLLLIYSPHNKQLINASAPSFAEVTQSLRQAARELSAIILVIALRALSYTGLLALLPLYFRSRNLSPIVGSHLLTIMLFVGAFGGLAGGFISDRYGRKRLIVGSLILSTPLFFAFFYTQGLISNILLGLAGATLMASFSVTVVAAQEAIPNNKSLAAGITMGMAGGIGNLLVIPIGHIGDSMGLPTAIVLLFVLPIIAGLAGLLMKSRPATRNQRLAAS